MLSASARNKREKNGVFSSSLHHTPIYLQRTLRSVYIVNVQLIFLLFFPSLNSQMNVPTPRKNFFYSFFSSSTTSLQSVFFLLFCSFYELEFVYFSSTTTTTVTIDITTKLFFGGQANYLENPVQQKGTTTYSTPRVYIQLLFCSRKNEERK